MKVPSDLCVPHGSAPQVTTEPEVSGDTSGSKKRMSVDPQSSPQKKPAQKTHREVQASLSNIQVVENIKTIPLLENDELSVTDSESDNS